jgi:energy-coupling factor transporter ATP-binding protein EcfA2
VLQQLDLETMNAAQSLGLVGWRISYSTETETKSGTQKLGVQVEVQSPVNKGPFSAWSGGEGQRIRLCTALGFGSLLQRWSGVRWCLEVFDEPTSWLSEAGIEDLLDLLKNRTDLMDKAILVADHRGLQHAGFDRILTVVKDAEGSSIQ